MHIVVFNHSPANLKLFEAALTAAGYKVSCFLQSPESVEFVAQLQPDLIILAYFAGYMENEVEMIHDLRANSLTKAIPILVCTTEPLASLKDRMPPNILYIGFLEKPFNISRLLQTIRQTLSLTS